MALASVEVDKLARTKRLFRPRLLSSFAGSAILIAGACWLFVFWAQREPPNYTRIEPGLYMGGYVERPPRGTQAVLNLCETEGPYRAEIHVWKPIADAPPAPSIEWLADRVDWIDAQRKAGKNVYVHCSAGISRSGMVVVAYEMRKRGISRDEALKLVRKERPEVRPNPAFMRLLEDWETALSRRR